MTSVSRSRACRTPYGFMFLSQVFRDHGGGNRIRKLMKTLCAFGALRTPATNLKLHCINHLKPIAKGL